MGRHEPIRKKITVTIEGGYEFTGFIEEIPVPVYTQPFRSRLDLSFDLKGWTLPHSFFEQSVNPDKRVRVS